MNKLIGVFAIALAFGVGSTACDRADERRRSEAPATRTDSPKTAKMSDSDLKNAVQAKLNSDEQLRAAKIDVDANADKNEVTLSGNVPSQDLRSKAVDLAKSAHSGITVNDKIDVKPAA